MVEPLFIAGSLGAVAALDTYTYYVYNKSKRLLAEKQKPKPIEASPDLHDSMQRMVESVKGSGFNYGSPATAEKVEYLGNADDSVMQEMAKEGTVEETFISGESENIDSVLKEMEGETAFFQESSREDDEAQTKLSGLEEDSEASKLAAKTQALDFENSLEEVRTELNYLREKLEERDKKIELIAREVLAVKKSIAAKKKR